jgi:hypothetical protein
MTRRQRNNQRRGGVSVLPLPPQKKFSQMQKSAREFPASNFLDQYVILIDYLPKIQTFGAEKYSSLLVLSKDILPRVVHQWGSCSFSTMLRLTGHLQPKRNWPNWASDVLITHPIFRVWCCWNTACSLD